MSAISHHWEKNNKNLHVYFLKKNTAGPLSKADNLPAGILFFYGRISHRLLLSWSLQSSSSRPNCSATAAIARQPKYLFIIQAKKALSCFITKRKAHIFLPQNIYASWPKMMVVKRSSEKWRLFAFDLYIVSTSLMTTPCKEVTTTRKTCSFSLFVSRRHVCCQVQLAERESE